MKSKPMSPCGARFGRGVDGLILVLWLLTLTGAPANPTARGGVPQRTTAGALDPGFQVSLDQFGEVLTAVIDPQGRVLLGGTFLEVNGQPRNGLARLLADGTLDRTFTGPSGIHQFVRRLVLLPDGRILIACDQVTVDGTARAGLARLNTDGSLDPAFQVSFLAGAGPTMVSALALESDGHILLATWAGGGSPINRLARLEADGTEAPGFAIPLDNICTALALQPDGKVLLGGGFSRISGVPRHGLARLHPNGMLDTGFNPGTGVAFVSGANAVGWVLCLAVQTNGQILAGGDFVEVNGLSLQSLARLDANGSVDQTYTHPFLAPGAVLALALQPDGKLLVGGKFNSIGQNSPNYIARLESNGALDPSFDPGGGVVGDEAEVDTIALQPDGRIVVGGNFDCYDGVPLRSVARILDTAPAPALTGPGSLDPTFDVTGGGRFPGISDGGADGIFALATLPDGRAIAGGAFGGLNGQLRLNVARLFPDGTLDTTFDTRWGTDGKVTRVAIQPDGRILMVGAFNTVQRTPRPNLARLNADGALDEAFAPFIQGLVFEVSVGLDGRIVISGGFTDVNGVARAKMARLFSDGSLDPTFDPSSVLTNAGARVGPVAVQPDGRVLTTRYEPIPGFSTRLIRLNANGTLDSTFNARLATPPADYFPGCFLPLRDGRIVLSYTLYSGSSNWITVSRLNSDGSLDPTFNPDKKPLHNSVSTMAEQPDGKLLLGGSFTQLYGVNRRGLARLNTDGSLDSTYNQFNAAGSRLPPDSLSTESVGCIALLTNGNAVVGMSLVIGSETNSLFQVTAAGDRAPGFQTVLNSMGSGLTDLVPLPDAKVLLCGNFSSINNVARCSLARLNRDGTLDQSLAVAVDGFVVRMVPQADGLILVGGYFTNYNGIACAGLVRIHADGALDPAFSIPRPSWSWNSGVGGIGLIALQTDGRILVGGSFDQMNGAPRHFFARLRADGTLDPAFVVDPQSWPNSFGFSCLAVQSDGKVLIGAQYDDYANGVIPYRPLVRYNADGSLDQPFLTRSPVTGETQSILVQPDGKILITGGVVNFTTTSIPVRLNADGSPDPTFTCEVPGYGAIALAPDGKILVNSTSNVFRLHPNGSLDTGFQARLSPWGGSRAEAARIALQSDGRVLIGGHFTAVNGLPALDIARLNGDGAPESFVVRQFTASTVRLLATPADGVSAYAVEDRPPAGWLVVNPGDGGGYDPITGQVKFGPFFDGEPRTLSYQALAPPGFVGVGEFTGVASADGVASPIAGETLLAISPPHPADHHPFNWAMSIDEVTAYGAVWRRGQEWPWPPARIPIDYVTRAAALWRNGECYSFSLRAGNPPLCWLGCAARIQPAAAAQGTPAVACARAESQLPAFFFAGEAISVTISVTPVAATAGYAVQDQYPAGWTVSGVSDNGEVDPVGRTVKWGPFLDPNSRALHYLATPPASARGVALFAGTASFDGEGQPVAGVRQPRSVARLTFCPPPAPNQFTINLDSEPGAVYLIEVSPDLKTWSTLTTLTNAAGRLEFSDPGRSTASPRFYRARKVE